MLPLVLKSLGCTIPTSKRRSPDAMVWSSKTGLSQSSRPPVISRADSKFKLFILLSKTKLQNSGSYQQKRERPWRKGYTRRSWLRHRARKATTGRTRGMLAHRLHPPVEIAPRNHLSETAPSNHLSRTAPSNRLSETAPRSHLSRTALALPRLLLLLTTHHPLLPSLLPPSIPTTPAQSQKNVPATRWTVQRMEQRARQSAPKRFATRSSTRPSAHRQTVPQSSSKPEIARREVTRESNERAAETRRTGRQRGRRKARERKRQRRRAQRKLPRTPPRRLPPRLHHLPHPPPYLRSCQLFYLFFFVTPIIFIRRRPTLCPA